MICANNEIGVFVLRPFWRSGFTGGHLGAPAGTWYFWIRGRGRRDFGRSVSGEVEVHERGALRGRNAGCGAVRGSCPPGGGVGGGRAREIFPGDPGRELAPGREGGEIGG